MDSYTERPTHVGWHKSSLAFMYHEEESRPKINSGFDDDFAYERGGMHHITSEPLGLSIHLKGVGRHTPKSSRSTKFKNDRRNSPSKVRPIWDSKVPIKGLFDSDLNKNSIFKPVAGARRRKIQFEKEQEKLDRNKKGFKFINRKPHKEMKRVRFNQSKTETSTRTFRKTSNKMLKKEKYNDTKTTAMQRRVREAEREIAELVVTSLDLDENSISNSIKDRRSGASLKSSIKQMAEIVAKNDATNKSMKQIIEETREPPENFEVIDNNRLSFKERFNLNNPPCAVPMMVRKIPPPLRNNTTNTVSNKPLNAEKVAKLYLETLNSKNDTLNNSTITITKSNQASSPNHETVVDIGKSTRTGHVPSRVIVRTPKKLQAITIKQNYPNVVPSVFELSDSQDNLESKKSTTDNDICNGVSETVHDTVIPPLAQDAVKRSDATQAINSNSFNVKSVAKFHNRNEIVIKNPVITSFGRKGSRSTSPTTLSTSGSTVHRNSENQIRNINRNVENISITGEIDSVLSAINNFEKASNVMASKWINDDISTTTIKMPQKYHSKLDIHTELNHNENYIKNDSHLASNRKEVDETVTGVRYLSKRNLISNELLEVVISSKEAYRNRRRLSDATLEETGYTHGSIATLLSDLILDDLLTEIKEEINECFDIYSNQLLVNL